LGRDPEECRAEAIADEQREAEIEERLIDAQAMEEDHPDPERAAEQAEHRKDCLEER